MPNVMTNPTNFQRRINSYVPAMSYSSDVAFNGDTRVSFGAPAAALATSLVSAQSIAVATTIDLTAATPVVEPYGRTMTYVASGASTATISLFGWDYLGQPIREDITMNGATPVVGKKAFKSFSQLVINTVTAATTINIGVGTGLGLPYKAIRAAYEIAAGVLAAAGTLTAAILTDPQTGSTGDPRGTYVATTALNGATIISGVFEFINDVNAANNGGLHGIRHFAA